MIEKFEMLVALARKQHFGRAAAACNFTPPSLSSAIRSLEGFYGVPLVQRGTRFIGITPEGEKVLARALHRRRGARDPRRPAWHTRRSVPPAADRRR